MKLAAELCIFFNVSLSYTPSANRSSRVISTIFHCRPTDTLTRLSSFASREKFYKCNKYSTSGTPVWTNKTRHSHSFVQHPSISALLYFNGPQYPRSRPGQIIQCRVTCHIFVTFHTPLWRLPSFGVYGSWGAIAHITTIAETKAKTVRCLWFQCIPPEPPITNPIFFAALHHHIGSIRCIHRR